jgi:peptidoglycan/LPS O-acetylase OafA/YrhL
VTSAANVTFSAPSYRPDVDGLRAIAVLSVILFHIDESLLPGGFVGVDIFFVISGFLISRNICQAIDSNRFSLLEFYGRRVKRIAPAMLLVVACTLILSHALLLPEDAERAAESALWSVLSIANVYFWLSQETSYFAAASNELPLLHLWSLGVEEQFYMLWPLILVIFYRASRIPRLSIFIASAALASFSLAQLLFPWDAGFVFYMLPTRAGELMIGALIALAVLRGAHRKIPAAAVVPMAVIGLSLIVSSLLFLSETRIFPGWLAVPPTVGTAFAILAGHRERNVVSRFLAVRPLVWVGLISYSAYLWHWPLLALVRYGYGKVDPVAGVMILVLTLLLAWSTYRFIEQPARRVKWPATRVLIRQYFLPAGMLGAVALAAMYSDGYALRALSLDYRARLSAARWDMRPAHDYEYVCQRQRLTRRDAEDERCVIGAHVAEPPRALLFGDSNAAHYVGMIGAFARAEGFRFRNMASGICPPIVGDPAPFVPAHRIADCREASALFREAIEEFPVIMVSASWGAYYERSSAFSNAFLDTMQALGRRGKLVILIGKVPPIERFDRRCREKAIGYPLLNCLEATAAPAQYVLEMNSALREFAEHNANVEYFDATSYLCPQNICSAVHANGEPKYYDAHHLTLPASWQLGEAIVAQSGVPHAFRLQRWHELVRVHPSTL